MPIIASRRQSASSGRFVGRVAEQQLFRAALRQLAARRFQALVADGCYGVTTTL